MFDNQRAIVSALTPGHNHAYWNFVPLQDEVECGYEKERVLF